MEYKSDEEISSDRGQTEDKAHLPELKIEVGKKTVARMETFCIEEQFGTEKTLR